MAQGVKQLANFVAVLALFCSALFVTPAVAADRGMVNINTATVEQLKLLPGIGQAKAKAIIEYRTKQSFASPDDLLKVKGIGKALLEKVRNQVVVNGETTAKAPSKRKRASKQK